jgi:hypothetical protein
LRQIKTFNDIPAYTTLVIAAIGKKTSVKYRKGATLIVSLSPEMVGEDENRFAQIYDGVTAGIPSLAPFSKIILMDHANKFCEGIMEMGI